MANRPQRDLLDDAADLAATVLQQLSHGDVDPAQASFEQAATAFADAAHTLDRPWTQPARLVPVVAQHRTSAVDLANGATDATHGRRRVAGFDLDSVRVVDGRIDVAAVEALQAPLDAVEATIDDLQQLVDEATARGWSRRSATACTSSTPRSTNIVGGSTTRSPPCAAPAILGRRRPPRVPRRVHHTGRGARVARLHGQLGRAEIDDGRIEMTRFSGTTELNEARRARSPPDRMDEFLARYGGYGVRTGPAAHRRLRRQVITMSPDFPSVGEAISQLYPQSGGPEIDGVFALDPNALAALLEFTGPIIVEGVPFALDSGNAEQFLDVEQYIELQDTPSTHATRSTPLHMQPSSRYSPEGCRTPRSCGDTFGPLVRAHHLAGWMVDPDRAGPRARSASIMRYRSSTPRARSPSRSTTAGQQDRCLSRTARSTRRPLWTRPRYSPAPST